MRRISTLMARTVWYFDLGEFNPKGLNLWPMCEALVAKYKFVEAPKSLLDLNAEKALAFRFGSFKTGKGEAISISLAVYNNALTADSLSDTEDSEQFLQEVSRWMAADFGLTVPDRLEKGYLSQLDIEMDFSLATFSPSLNQFAERLTNSVKSVMGPHTKFDFGALQFWSNDPNQTTAPAMFRFERKIGIDVKKNRYFTQAPLTTSGHIEFLAAFEAAFKQKG